MKRSMCNCVHAKFCPYLWFQLKKLSLHEIPDVSIKKQAKPTSPQSNNEEKDKETEEESAEKEEKEKDEEEKEEQEPEKENELRTYTEEELEAFSVDDIQYRLTHLDSELEKMKPNLTVIDDYKKKVCIIQLFQLAFINFFSVIMLLMFLFLFFLNLKTVFLGSIFASVVKQTATAP